MSDPVTNVEDVEDVLSSIRRLVTDTSSDRRSATKGAADAQADKPDALVLTSALRIKDDEIKETETDQGEDAPAEEVRHESATAPSELESLRRAVSGGYDDDVDDDMSEDDAAEETAQSQADDVDPNWSKRFLDGYYEDEATDTVDAMLERMPEGAWDKADQEDIADHEEVADQDEVAEVAAEDDVELTAKSSSEDNSDEADPETSAEIHQFSTVDHDGEEAGDESDELEHDGHEEASVKLDEADTDHADIDEAAIVEIVEAEAEAVESETTEDNSDEDATDDQDVLDASLAWVESSQEDELQVEEPAPISSEHDEVETVGIASFLRSSGQSRVDDVTEPVDTGDDASMFDDADDTPQVDLGDLDEAVIDEDMLRDLISEIVRQELTGAMGERITRNVRKLVRREIHRAMVAREFD